MVTSNVNKMTLGTSSKTKAEHNNALVKCSAQANGSRLN